MESTTPETLVEAETVERAGIEPLGGIDVGNRWGPIAANWAPKAGAANYAFNDAHAMMAFVGAGFLWATRKSR